MSEPELVEETFGPVPGSPASFPLEERAPSFASSYGLRELEKDKASELVTIARLPAWSTTGSPPPAAFGDSNAPDGHGMGEHFAKAIGGGLRPGEMLAIGASSAGAGKTAWLMQLVDGLALRNVDVLRGDDSWGKVLTPVLIASEMGIDALSWRSLARWTGHSSSVFRGGKTILDRGDRFAENAWEEAERALGPSSSFGASRSWLRLVNAPHASALLSGDRGGPRVFVEELHLIVEAWREKLAKEHNREVVPIVVLDPLQRYQGGDDAIDALNELSRSLCASTVENKWITLVTSDTNKAAAKGEKTAGASDAEEATAAFRGSYNLMHEVTAAIALRTTKSLTLSADEQQRGVRFVEAIFAKQRWGSAAQPGPHFVFEGPTLRFFPMTRDKTEQALKAANEREASKDRAQPRSTKAASSTKADFDE